MEDMPCIFGYKNYFDRRVRKPKTALSPGSFVFARREYANLKTEKKHKLSPIADRPYLVISVQETTVVLEIDGQHEEFRSTELSKPLPHLRAS